MTAAQSETPADLRPIRMAGAPRRETAEATVPRRTTLDSRARVVPPPGLRGGLDGFGGMDTYSHRVYFEPPPGKLVLWGFVLWPRRGES